MSSDSFSLQTDKIHAIAQRMDAPSSPHICLKPSNPDLQQQYRQIGRLLVVCEAACYRIGIAWLPPTAEIRERISAFQGPLDEFVRLSLVTVSTQTLECYLSDLSDSQAEDADSLFIPMPGFFSRYLLAALMFGSFFSANCLLGSYLGYGLSHSLTASLTLAIVAAGFGGLMANEVVRRRSFAVVLEQELNRRRGAGGDAPTITVSTAIENKVVSD